MMRCFVFTLMFRVSCSFAPGLNVARRPEFRRQALWRATSLLKASTTTTNEKDDTLVKLNFGDQCVTLVGTAHLSKASNEQVKSVIESTQPQVVMVELDENRLHRIGIESTDDLGLPYATANDIQVPLQPDDKLPKPWWTPLQDLLLNGITRVARGLLTGMYNDMGDSMGQVGGGEFLAAINAAKNSSSCEKIVLGDRDSLITIRRVAELAVRSGDPLGVLERLSQINDAEVEQLQQQVLKDMPLDKVNDDGYLTTATIEALKADTDIRERIFARLEREVPEFTRAFLTERDFIMAKAIQREISNGANQVVAVVGLAHVPGIVGNLETAFAADEAETSQ